jgi:hypothetical protein
MPQRPGTKQNLTLSLNRETVRKAKILAAQRSTSISGLLAEEIERLVAEEDDWLRAERSALAMLTQGFHLGGRITATRDELHER